ncbi:MAG: class 3 fructose-bisphosphatase [Firmicutes bacterium HGW-Firmicutes-1]|jgi:fructose-1,6-bisphosphatase-3|nr:MAG: class 3 fructose-bisphosphatase [Firmicutes bacterium HGW-Firmicutes-1]
MNDELLALDEIERNKKYLYLLKKQFPNIQAASTEIINLQAILSLPKGTEHFLSDLHGEYEAFIHVLKNGSGVVRKKIEDVFRTTITSNQKSALAQLIYYPKEVLLRIEDEDIDEWYATTLHRLIKVCREVSSKYTRSKVRKALPKDFIYIIEELLHEQENVIDKQYYYDEIIRSIIRTEQSKPFIVAICELIQHLAIDHLHIIGDVYDRGPGSDIIMDTLLDYHSLDIQWGNHDIAWLGAASGSLLCIANTIRVSVKAGNINNIEESYGISLLPLAKFAMDTYPEVHDIFKPSAQNGLDKREDLMSAQIHNAISIIQFKLEGQLIQRKPSYNFECRLFLDKIDYENSTVNYEGKVYPLRDNHFPTIDPNDPYTLTAEEMDIMLKLKQSFLRNEKLQKHMDLMLSKGSMYLAFNGNLLYHGCIPMNHNKEFESFELNGKFYSGRALIDQFEIMVREAYANRMKKFEEKDVDFFWYLTTGENSSLFGKKKITTFERYYIEDPATHAEAKNPYYTWVEEKSVCELILAEFGLYNTNARIINGHVPVKVKKGESPIKADGKLLVIDGGLSKAYQNETGIAGYTLIYNSHGMILAAHEPFETTEKAIQNNRDIFSKLTILENRSIRILVADTDIGILIKKDIYDLELLLLAYRKGIIK